MKTITIKTQSELDALPLSFDEFTVIRIESDTIITITRTRENSRVVARGNSRVVAWGNSSVEARENSSVVARENSRVEARENSRVVARGNSRVEARGNSSVEARENSSVEAFLCATILVFSTCVTLRRICDNAHIIYKKEGCQRPDILDNSVKITEFSDLIDPTFEQWLERGYVVADGIHQKLVSQKTIGEVTIFETTDFFEKEKTFVAKIGNKFAHGRTVEEAKNDLRYKLSDRDTSKYRNWNKDEKKPLDQMIEAYMTITGACSFGTKQFIETMSNKIKDQMSVNEVIQVTIGSYGNEQFERFFNERN